MRNPAETVVTKREHAVSRVVDGEAVIVESMDGMVNVISTVGSTIWELADGKHTVLEIAETVAEEYEVSLEQALKDALEFLGDMREKGLVCFQKTENR